MTDLELLQMALDALEAAYHPDTKAGEVMEAISARLEQPGVKTYSGGKPNYTQPILSGGSGSTHLIHLHGGWCFLKKDEPVIDKSMAKVVEQVEPKRKWVGLTEEEIFTSWKHYADIAREVEAMLREKNT